MGNTFGNTFDNGINLHFYPDETPHPLKEPTTDPQLGFGFDRKPREVKATIEDMMSAKIPIKNRDYCIDFLLNFKACRKDAWPFPVKCEHEKHEYLTCQHEDFVLRMKEYEREKRLMKRANAVAAQ